VPPAVDYSDSAWGANCAGPAPPLTVGQHASRATQLWLTSEMTPEAAAAFLRTPLALSLNPGAEHLSVPGLMAGALAGGRNDHTSKLVAQNELKRKAAEAVAAGAATKAVKAQRVAAALAAQRSNAAQAASLHVEKQARVAAAQAKQGGQ
jgi:hypothetical protein